MNFSTRLASAAFALAAAAAPALAQPVVAFSTTGAFSGAGCTATSCTFGGFNLSFTGSGTSAYFSPSAVDLGQFVTTATGASQPSTPIGAGTGFTLTVNQTSPTAGTNAIVGSVAGSLAFNPSQSSLVFTPTNRAFTIDGVAYTLITDNSGNINIAAPLASTGNNPNTTIVKANVVANVVPEPSTYALMGLGLAGTLAAARRRRSA